MNKSKIINLVAIIAAIAIVASTSAVFITRYKDNQGGNVTNETITSFEIIGNADSENSDLQTQVITKPNGETETQIVTTTNKNEKPVSRPSDTQTVIPPYQSTSKIDESTPVNKDTASQQAGIFGFT